MATLLIIAIVFFFAWVLTDGVYNSLAFTALASALLALVATVVSGSAAPPAGCTEVDSVSYMTEAGYIETLEDCDYYTDGTDYYELNLTKASWVPFAPAEYVKVELPGKVVSWKADDDGDSGQVDGLNRSCTSCGNKLNEADKFCSGCGTGQPEHVDVAERFCTNCGKELNETDKFCGGCGAAVEAKK